MSGTWKFCYRSFFDHIVYYVILLHLDEVFFWSHSLSLSWQFHATHNASFPLRLLPRYCMLLTTDHFCHEMWYVKNGIWWDMRYDWHRIWYAIWHAMCDIWYIIWQMTHNVTCGVWYGMYHVCLLCGVWYNIIPYTWYMIDIICIYIYIIYIVWYMIILRVYSVVLYHILYFVAIACFWDV